MKRITQVGRFMSILRRDAKREEKSEVAGNDWILIRMKNLWPCLRVSHDGRSVVGKSGLDKLILMTMSLITFTQTGFCFLKCSRPQWMNDEVHGYYPFEDIKFLPNGQLSASDEKDIKEKL